MTPEDKILERLNAIEDRLADLQAGKENSSLLMEQLTPIGNHAFRLMVEELEILNGRVTLDDILDLARKGLLTVPRLTWLLDQIENATDLWHVLHPAVGQTFPHIVEKMGQWEQKGVFKKAAALKDAGGNLLDGMTPEDIKQYIRFIADWRLRQLQLPEVYGVTENPLPWLQSLLSGVEHANFFEARATEYSKAATKGSWHGAEGVWTSFDEMMKKRSDLTPAE